ncbi:PREDICTED: protein NRDE2 homolog isoform X2 [Camelina sativa]|uniref:Protein NRDE2 homolog isoform X2 n=1 Tax=Camelina sativa TaxID=90675 RepID=A0ABM0XLE2_CAMSA|nr:PREDICTED: protein NRDE2 homolog isoform X2 [Camelina sativa]
MKMSNTPEDGDGAPVTTGGLFPVFPTSTNSVSVISTNTQWLRNASFTTDLSVINAAAASTAPYLSEVEEDEEGDADENIGETNQPKVYNLVEEEASWESDDDDVKRKGKKKRKKRKIGTASDESRSKKSSVRDSDEYYSKPAKDYYLDTRPDPDNLAYGSIYRMNVPRYKLDSSQRVSGEGSLRNYLRNRRSSMLDTEIDIDSLEGRGKSDNRYWYAKNAAMERNKNFKRIRLSASKEAVDSSFDDFIPLVEDEAVQESDEEDVLPKDSMMGASWEDEVLNKTREFNRMTRERPHDEKAWLAFADFQDKVSSMQSQKGVRLQMLEKKISILEKAFELNPDCEELLIALLKAYRIRDNADVLISRWEKALMQNSASYKLWREFLCVVQGEFSRFKVSELRKMYSYAIQALSSACSKRHRQVDATSEPLDSAAIQQELLLVDMLVSLCRFEWQAGYQELATALFQAEVEFSVFCPSLLLTEQSKLRLFEHFWSSNGARVGEEGAFGWSLWLEKEEENRHKILKEESSDDNEVGGWTGWTEQVSGRNKDSIASANTVEDDVVREGLDEEMEDENSKPEDDTEAMLKLLGIDVNAAASDEVKDTSTWIKWFEEEVSRDLIQWMPTRKAGEFSRVDEMGEGEDEDQLSSVVLFEDINGFLFSLRSNEARLSLVYQFIDFFGAHMSPWTSSNSLSWSEKISSLETLPDSLLENLRSVQECLSKSESVNSFSLGSLLSGSCDISMRTEMMKFLRNAILLCLNVFPRNHILEEAVLVAEELFVTNMKTCEVATTPCQALAKRLLKSDRQDLLLCGVYAQREAASGNMKHARRVFDMALASICGLPKELQYNASLLCLWYAESEIANSSSRDRDTESSSRALHILCYLGSGLAYTPYTSQSSSMQILRARQGFKEKLKKIQSAWSHGVTDDQSAALVCSVALFEELTNDLPGAVEILEHMFSSVLPGRKSQSHQLELLLNYYVRMLQRHQDDLTLSQIWKPISEGLQLYPLSPELYRALVDICNHRMTSHRLRMMFDDYSRNPSVVVWLFALSYELSKGGASHRIRGLFERAFTQDTLKTSVILWRCYIAYEIDIAHNPSAARRIYFRAINACPWSKKLWLDGDRKLSSVLTVKEMSDLQEVMRDKELNIRTDIYEILLMQG